MKMREQQGEDKLGEQQRPWHGSMQDEWLTRSLLPARAGGGISQHTLQSDMQ